MWPEISVGIPFALVPARIISVSYLYSEPFSHWRGIVSMFVLWGLFNSQFIHCTDDVILLRLPHVFGTCLDWCSEFSCNLRVKPHFINTHFKVCSFYTPYAKPVWSNCQCTSQVWVAGYFPLVHWCTQRRVLGSLTLTRRCFLPCLWETWCIHAQPLVVHEWRRGLAPNCSSWCMSACGNGSGFRARSYQCCTRGAQRSVLVPGCSLLDSNTALYSELLSLETICHFRHWFRKFSFISPRQMLSGHWYRDKQSPKIWQIWMILAVIIAVLWQRRIS